MLIWTSSHRGARNRKWPHPSGPKGTPASSPCMNAGASAGGVLVKLFPGSYPSLAHSSFTEVEHVGDLGRREPSNSSEEQAHALCLRKLCHCPPYRVPFDDQICRITRGNRSETRWLNGISLLAEYLYTCQIILVASVVRTSSVLHRVIAIGIDDE